MNFSEWRESEKILHYRGHEIKFWEAGEGDGLLLIHGFPTASWDWHAIWEDLKQHYRVIALDMIGFGFSAKPKNYAYSILDQADLQQALCKKLGVNSTSILTHDYGNSVTQELLARCSEHDNASSSPLMIEKICYLNGGLFPEAHRPLLIQKLLLGPFGGLISRMLSKRRFETNIREIFGPNTQPSRGELDNFWALIEQNNQRAITHKLAQYQVERRKMRERWVQAMQNTSIPQRFIVGLHDPISGANMATRYREIVPGPDIVELEEIGHWPQLETPERVLKAFSEFMMRES